MKNSGEDTVVLSREEYNNLLSENAYLKQELANIKRMLYGMRSERFIPADTSQLKLELEIEQEPEPVKPSAKKTGKKKEKQNGHSRQPIPDCLPREVVIIEPDHDLTGYHKIGEVVSEILEYIPGKIIVKRIIRPKYAKLGQDGIIIADMPSVPISRGNAGASLLAYIIVCKYLDHLPFYRQVKMFKRLGIAMAESTMNDWFRKSCDLLEPLYVKLAEKMLSGDYLQADETPIKVLTSEKEGAAHKGFFWAYHCPVNNLVYFEYLKGRGAIGPKDFLEDFKGAVQTDNYKGYDFFDKEKDIEPLACMAHVRRKFFEAKNNDPSRAEFFLKKVGKLYQIEAIAREAEVSYEERKKIRQKKAVHRLTKLEKWLKDQLPDVLPQSAIGKAVIHALKQWPKLKKYVEQGKWEIDNNKIENTIRPIALGRKNYMFAGSHEGAERAAIAYSLLGTCKLLDINPQEWLEDVLNRINDCKATELDQLLPQNWKK